ncbi:AfsR/SARP family transcriptional regulator [Longispora fulva]|uniref:DNA-binding SARP family transcriptional activator n=1 Tax=Longispora fulva TaxID=619741 RepID=A0A8J7GFD6_9ACTN|nr:AfsR/SARP family transcriptional regulator [Longispora fulva]MBG6137814.1 DNA-binding SARP family transcriptional activator [Longispora fulva]
MPVFRVLGPVAVSRGGGDPAGILVAQQRALLAALLLRPDEWVAADRLVDVLWPAHAPRSPARRLSGHVFRLRALLTALTGEPRVESQPGGYRLRLHPGQLDLHVFEDLAERGRRAYIAGDPDLAALLLTEALAVWRAEPYADVPAELVAHAARGLRERRLMVHEHLVEAELARGRAEAVVPLVRGLLADTPRSERLWTQLITAYGRLERRADALAAYQQALLVLRELGPQVRAAHRLVQGA